MNIRKLLVLLAFTAVSFFASAQKVDSLYFNLYTDSLKKGFFNYINVDAKMSDGSWRPLDSTYISLTSNAGKFIGNELFIDSSYKAETVKVKAVLKSNHAVWRETIIYIRKRGFDEPLKTDKELLDEMRKTKVKVKTKS
jgi:hypothetical protein